MQVIIAAFLSMLPGILLQIIKPLISEELIADVLRRVIVRGLRKAATLTANTLDDEIAEEVIAKLEGKKGAPAGGQ